MRRKSIAPPSTLALEVLMNSNDTPLEVDTSTAKAKMVQTTTSSESVPTFR